MEFSLELVGPIRMKKVATLVMLLAGLLVCTAHDTDSNTVTMGWSTTESTASQSEESTKQSAARIKSIVVNQTLVCEDLCGAGFGGPRCGERCTRHASSSSLFSAVNNKHNTEDLCSVLCAFDLGGENCKCDHHARSRAPTNPKYVCDIVCQRFQIHIGGCSKCSEKEPEGDSLHSSNPPKSTPSELMGTPPAGPTEATSSTTISSTTSEVGDGSTEPDWNEVCKHLCNKGDGGSLCNCDLPPLSRSN